MCDRQLPHSSLITFMLSAKIKKRLGNTGDSAADEFLLDIEISAQPGVTILFGASGSGKTMTLKSIAGIIRPDQGIIEINGDTLFDSARAIDLKMRQRGVGYVYQNLAIDKEVWLAFKTHSCYLLDE
ncbi:MAG: ATP-binding cassette domain-containing protein [Blastocatellia bacterium]